MSSVELIPAGLPARAQDGVLPSPAAGIATFSLQLEGAEAKWHGYFNIAIVLRLTALLV